MKPNVLLVDDNVSLLSTLRLILEKHGCRVVTAVSAAEAKDRLATAEFDLVLTDMKMESDLAGFEVVHAASAKPERPVILIMTAFPLLTRQWREAGAHHVFIKPTAMKDLLDAIDKLLAVRRETGAEDARHTDAHAPRHLRRA